MSGFRPRRTRAWLSLTALCCAASPLAAQAPAPTGPRTEYPGVVPGTAHLPPVGRPTRGSRPAVVTWTGFQPLPGGESRFFVQTSGLVEIAVRADADRRYTVILKNVGLGLANSALPLETAHFATPVLRAMAQRRGPHVAFVLELRQNTQPILTTELTREGYYFVYLTFPPTGTPSDSPTLPAAVPVPSPVSPPASDATNRPPRVAGTERPPENPLPTTPARMVRVPPSAVAPPQAAPDRDDSRSDFHIDVDVQYEWTAVDFLSAARVTGEAVPEGVPCPPDLAACKDPPQARDIRGLRGTVGIGLGVSMVEAAFTIATDSSDYRDLVAGIRVDSGVDVFAFHFRLGYLRRWGDLAGSGASVGAGLVLRPVDRLALYAEVRGEATSVSGAIREAGAYAALGWSAGGGVRYGFGF